jgi:dihydroorotate dehydrogenase
MPSKEPAVWRKDVEAARRGLRGDQALVVSVVASPEQGWSLGDITADFVQCARWAKDAGAQAVEANLSCPNVCSQEGQLYHSPDASREISAAMAAALGDVPLVLKIGLFDNAGRAAAFIAAVGGYASALTTVNSISATVQTDRGEAAFHGSSRGIGGECVRDRCQSELAMLASVAKAEAPGLRLIGVGGLSTAEDARRRLLAGAHHVQFATAAMLDPLVAIRIRQQIADHGNPSAPVAIKSAYTF